VRFQLPAAFGTELRPGRIFVLAMGTSHPLPAFDDSPKHIGSGRRDGRANQESAYLWPKYRLYLLNTIELHFAPPKGRSRA
jgi:hypothetical protein